MEADQTALDGLGEGRVDTFPKKKIGRRAEVTDAEQGQEGRVETEEVREVAGRGCASDR